MQNEKDFFYHCNVFEQTHDFEQVFRKSDDVFLVFGGLNNNVCLYDLDYCKFFQKS